MLEFVKARQQEPRGSRKMPQNMIRSTCRTQYDYREASESGAFPAFQMSTLLRLHHMLKARPFRGPEIDGRPLYIRAGTPALRMLQNVPVVVPRFRPALLQIPRVRTSRAADKGTPLYAPSGER